METVPSQSLPPPPPPETADSESSEAETKREKEILHKTKVVHFLGRNAPIVLQNDNGPCPLLAICNILSLRNSLNLSPDIPEVSQEKLLSLVAERLIDSNSNVDGKDSGYLENQQQNIADAIDLLPRLTTGIDVNIKFTRIDDFEFTRECTIFDLLDIPLYHGWIVDPQDHETAEAIGSKSYNTLMGELVFLETQMMENEQRNSGNDDVDFVAATTAALGVPSPCLSRDHSFEGSPLRAKKGDIEEEAELVRALKLSEEKLNSSPDGAIVHVSLDENAGKAERTEQSEVITDEIAETEKLLHDVTFDLSDQHLPPKFPAVDSQDIISPISTQEHSSQPTCEESIKHGIDASQTGLAAVNGISEPDCVEQDPLSTSDNLQDIIRSEEITKNGPNATSHTDEVSNNENSCKESDSSSVLLNAAADSDSSCGRMPHIDGAEAFSSSVDGSEPLYEGEERILDSAPVVYENREPVYEGEVLLAEQVDSDCVDESSMKSKGTISIRQGELIRNFMKSSASQLTVYGLFSLQEKVKERELCVFFRNNHFNTMFKYEGELYILVTDQGYMNQPDLVWEKLNEVNGDTQYTTGNFKEFKMDDQSNTTWSQQTAMASTADYLASIDQEAGHPSSFNSDLQLAIALQQQEFEQQQHEQQPRRDVQQQQQQQQPAITATSGLITGPQVPRRSEKYGSSSSSRPDSKSKERCIVM